MTKKNIKIISSFIFLVVVSIFWGILTYNPKYMCEDVLLNIIDRINENNICNNKNELFYSRIVNQDKTLLENIYISEKNVEYEQVEELQQRYPNEKLIQNLTIDENELTNMYNKLDSKNHFYIIKSFINRIEDSFNVTSKESLKSIALNFLCRKENEVESFYIISENFYRPGIKKINYYKIHIFIQKENQFVYMSFFDKGELLYHPFTKDFIQEFSSCFDRFYNFLLPINKNLCD